MKYITTNSKDPFLTSSLVCILLVLIVKMTKYENVHVVIFIIVFE